MHSSEFKLKGFTGPVTVLHNSDWSGEAKILYQEAGVRGILPDQEPKEVSVPGHLLIALALPVAKKAIIDKTISALEQIDVNKI